MISRMHDAPRLPPRTIALTLAFWPVACWSLAALAPAEPVEIRCPCIADTTVSTIPPHGPTSSGGGLDRVVAESNRRYAFFKFDTSQFGNIRVTRAVLRLKRIEHLLVRAGVSTVAADWREGISATFEPEPGAACFNFAAYQQDIGRATWWAAAGGDASDVIFGGGGSRWAPVVPAFDRQSMWYDIEIPAALAQAVAQGLQPGGFCLSDDFGRIETSPTFWSRESSSPPELVIYGERVEPAASSSATSVRAFRDELGLEWIEFEAPRAIGFEIYVSAQPLKGESDLDAARKLETWALPPPGAGARRSLLSFHRTSTDRFVGVRVVEPAGQWSPLAVAELPPAIQSNPTLPEIRLPRHPLPPRFDRPFTMHDGPALSEDGRWIRTEATTWWNPFEGPIPLESGRNEFVAFQVVLAGGAGEYSVLLADWQSPAASANAPRATLYREHYVRSRLGEEKFAPDALVPLVSGETMQFDLLSESAASQPSSAPVRRRVVQAVWVEIHVPNETPPGVWKTRIVATRDGAALLDVPVELTVVAAALPDKLRFAVCLDAERTPGQIANVAPESPEAWSLLESYHRLAHAHRATLAVIPYAPLGQMHAGFAPEAAFGPNGVTVEWSAWRSRFERYLDGTAFRDLPRAGVPLAIFYLPFHEAWPLGFAPRKADARARLAEKYHFRTTLTERTSARTPNPRAGDYLAWPIETAFSAEHAERTRQVRASVSAELAERGWDATAFQFFLHNRAGDSRGSSWWNFDPPQIHDDVLALRFWLGLYAAKPDVQPETPSSGTATRPSPGVTLERRASMAQPLIQRDTLDGLAEVTVLIPGLNEKAATLATRPDRYGKLWISAGDIGPELGWTAIYKWVWSAALAGATGVHVPDSLGDAESWRRADDRALLYPASQPASSAEAAAPQPSLRLKALCRAQQDIEWLESWIAAERARGTPRGYALAIAAALLLDRTHARTPNWTTVLPIVRFPGTIETVALEELRRSLRAAAGSEAPRP